jgi:hypothetical protein
VGSKSRVASGAWYCVFVGGLAESFAGHFAWSSGRPFVRSLDGLSDGLSDGPSSLA